MLSGLLSVPRMSSIQNTKHQRERIMGSNRAIIKQAATEWAKSGCGLPCEVVVKDWRPTPLCCERLVVVLTFAEYRYYPETAQRAGYGSIDGDAFLGEFSTRAEANRAAGQYRRHLYAAYDAAMVK